MACKKTANNTNITNQKWIVVMGICYSSEKVLPTMKIINVMNIKHHFDNAEHKECVVCLSTYTSNIAIARIVAQMDAYTNKIDK